MPKSDGPGADPYGLDQKDSAQHVHSQLVEALIFLLIEKGVLTKNDALSIIQTVAQVQQGEADGVQAGDPSSGALQMLQRLYLSFDTLSDSSRVTAAQGENVVHMRPPIYDGRPEFPRDD